MTDVQSGLGGGFVWFQAGRTYISPHYWSVFRYNILVPNKYVSPITDVPFSPSPLPFTGLRSDELVSYYIHRTTLTSFVTELLLDLVGFRFPVLPAQALSGREHLALTEIPDTCAFLSRLAPGCCGFFRCGECGGSAIPTLLPLVRH